MCTQRNFDFDPGGWFFVQVMDANQKKKTFQSLNASSHPTDVDSELQVSLLVLWNNGSDDQAVLVLATQKKRSSWKYTNQSSDPVPIDTYPPWN